MPFFHTWSVASAFNRWGDDGWEGSGGWRPGGDGRWWRPHRERRTGGRAGKTGVMTTEVVANVIRSLGYIVTCSPQPAIDNGSWGGCYIIMSIQSQDGKYIYGCSREDEQYIGKRVETRPLLGHRTIWDWAGWRVGRELRNAEDLKSVICEDDIISAIECGATAVAANLHHLEYDRIQFDAEYAGCRCPGVGVRVKHEHTGISTIGNVLPSDIVEILRDFRNDDFTFRTEVDWEFYMSVMACPVAEEAAGVAGGAAGSANASAAGGGGAVAVAPAAAPPAAGDTDGSDSSSDEDDA